MDSMDLELIGKSEEFGQPGREDIYQREIHGRTAGAPSTSKQGSSRGGASQRLGVAGASASASQMQDDGRGGRGEAEAGKSSRAGTGRGGAGRPAGVNDIGDVQAADLDDDAAKSARHKKQKKDPASKGEEFLK